jgi:hypothetical protein
VSKNSVLPHSLPPVRRLDAAKCWMVAIVCASRVAASTPARSGSYCPRVSNSALPSTTAKEKSVAT